MARQWMTGMNGMEKWMSGRFRTNALSHRRVFLSVRSKVETVLQAIMANMTQQFCFFFLITVYSSTGWAKQFSALGIRVKFTAWVKTASSFINLLLPPVYDTSKYNRKIPYLWKLWRKKESQAKTFLRTRHRNKYDKLTLLLNANVLSFYTYKQLLYLNKKKYNFLFACFKQVGGRQLAALTLKSERGRISNCNRSTRTKNSKNRL